MNAVTIDSARPRAPVWLLGAASFGVLWNVFGLIQFVGSFTQTTEALMAAGMSRMQADIYLGLPTWISVAFAIGVVGGLLGSSALLLGRRSAQPVLAVSLMGYVLLFAGDTYYGVFAAIPSQLAILVLVLLVAGALLGVSWLAGRQRLLF